MASVELSRRVEKVVCYPPLAEMDEPQRQILDAGGLEQRLVEFSTKMLGARDR